MAKRAGGKRRSGNAKHGRQKKKESRRGSAISLFARDKIPGDVYFKLTNQPLKKRG